MIATLIKAAMDYRWLVLILAAGVCGFGIWSFTQQSIDAYPDISSQMVQVITVYPGRAPEEVERQVTIPIEIAMRGVPRSTTVRSRTIFGLSVIQVLFEEGTDNYWVRQRVSEKLQGVTLPDGVKPDLGPLATAYGEIFRYQLVSDRTSDLMELRTLNDWVVIPRLLRARGVADVSNFGGHAKQFAIVFLPAQLERYALVLNDVVDAIKNNNTSSGGSVMRRGSMSYVIRGRGSLERLDQIKNIFLKSISGTPVYVKDVAQVTLDAKAPSGIYSKDEDDESVEGIVLMRRGENPSRTLKQVQEAVDELNSTGLPEGVKIIPFYDRTQLVDNTLHTVAHSVLLGITLVVLVLLLFLGRPAMAALVALTIPFSLLFALCLMWLTGIPIGLLSIGAIDFGIIVDGAVIMAENIARRLGEAKEKGGPLDVFGTVFKAAAEMERVVFFSVIMIVVAYLPLLSLPSIEGLLFRPMAITMVYALVGALLFSLFVVPVLAIIVFRHGYTEWHNPLLLAAMPVYRVTLRGLLSFRWIVLACATIGMALVFLRVTPHLGFEFLPYMDEGVIWVRANFPEGTSLQQTSAFGQRVREIAGEFEDIRFVSVQTGRNDSGTDPFPPSRMEIMIGPRPRERWTQFRTKPELLAALGKRLREEFPTTRFNFTQPIIDSVTEDTNGTSANLAVEFTGPDNRKLLAYARRTAELLRSVRGAADVAIEQEGPQPQLVIQPDRVKCARFNVRIDDVSRVINTALGAEPISTLYEGERRFDIVAKFDPAVTNSPAAIGRLPVFTTDGVPVPLSQVAKIEVVDGQTIIARENGKRRTTVRCDIVGRDQGGFVADAQKKFKVEIEPDVTPDYNVEWLGMFANLERAREHFLYLIPITVAIIFAMLLVTFGEVRSALLVLLGIPFACVGGLIALWVRDMHVNVSTGVGFCALFGIAIMDGVLMVRGINVLRSHGMGLDEAIEQGAEERLRPILMTAIVAILGLLPASLATGLGSDVQRPLATVIVWGLFSSTFLTLFVVPVLYRVLVPHVPHEAPQEAETATPSSG
jgi:cobalt-zinc-cadmium resistance protein CzcA